GDFLGAQQADFEFRIIHARPVGALAYDHIEPRALEQIKRGLLQAALGQPEAERGFGGVRHDGSRLEKGRGKYTGTRDWRGKVALVSSTLRSPLQPVCSPPDFLMNKDILQKAANEARGLAMDAVHKCSSGHLGLPLGSAEVGAVLFGESLQIDP